MLEKEIERKLTEAVKRIGGKAYKFISPGNDGVPDRLIVMPEGRIIFVELKTETGKLSIRQELQLKKLSSLGAECWVLYGEAEVTAFVGELKGEKSDGVHTARISEAGYRVYRGA